MAYPNSYRVGMSNLGFQAVLGAFLEQPGFHARRVFWEGGSLRFPDGGRSLGEFDAVAISISYQPDMVHLPRMMEAVMAAGDPEAAPLVIGGGVALTINPETSSPLFDIVVLGDAEPVLPALMNALGSGRPSKRDIISRLRGREGVYIPGDFGGRAGARSPAAPSPAPTGGVPAQRPAGREGQGRWPARPAG
ncbi:MAG: hypothetical protein JSV00_07755, partial [bacterium]